ncbi:hypothetical protein BGX30_013816, partial [Mortierella sp. GBA39]
HTGTSNQPLGATAKPWTSTKFRKFELTVNVDDEDTYIPNLGCHELTGEQKASRRLRGMTVDEGLAMGSEMFKYDDIGYAY